MQTIVGRDSCEERGASQFVFVCSQRGVNESLSILCGNDVEKSTLTCCSYFWVKVLVLAIFDGKQSQSSLPF